jgi:hypothetical protein
VAPPTVETPVAALFLVPRLLPVQDPGFYVCPGSCDTMAHPRTMGDATLSYDPRHSARSPNVKGLDAPIPQPQWTIRLVR